MEPAKQDKKDKKKDWADMEDEADHDDEEIGAAKNEGDKKAEAKPAKAAGAGNKAAKGKKNQAGDFIVTSFDVDATIGVKK